MIKIAFVIDAIYSPTGGTEKQLLTLLKNLDRGEFAPTLCLLRTSEWVEKEFDLCPLYTIGIESFKNLETCLNIFKFCQFLARERFDIVQTYYSDANKTGILAAKLAGVKIIISSRRNQWYLSSFGEKLTLRLFDRFVNHFVANSLSTAELVVRAEGIPVNKVSVIYNAFDLESFKDIDLSTRNCYRHTLAIPDNAIVVGIVANLREIKGLDVFIRAARKVKDSYPEAVFLIIGSCASDGIEERKLSMLSKNLGLVESVYFLGERLDVPQLLAVFDIAVLTSRSEGFSNSLVEYIATGLPVVTTDVGGAREVVINGVNGFVVPVNDYESVANAIIDIAGGCLNNNDLMVKKHEAHEKFSLTQSIKAHEAMYLKLMNY